MKEKNPVINVPESAVMEQVIGYLDMHHYWYQRTNTGGVKVPDESKKKGYRYVQYGTKGFPDFLFAFEFQNISIIGFIETKSTKGVQTEEQKLFQEEAEKRNMLYILAKGYNASEDVEKGIEQYKEKLEGLWGEIC